MKEDLYPLATTGSVDSAIWAHGYARHDIPVSVVKRIGPGQLSGWCVDSDVPISWSFLSGQRMKPPPRTTTLSLLAAKSLVLTFPAPN